MAVAEYKCPNCGGGITFNSNSQRMQCPYCDAEFDVEAVKAFAESEESQEDSYQWADYENEANAWSEEEKQNIKQYTCQSCGGQIISDGNTVATSCPYCDNPTIIEDRVDGVLRPSTVIPFKLDKKAAKEALRNHVSHKFFLPHAFKTDNHLEELKGVYVPFWLFDADASGSSRYRCTRVRTWTSGDYRYTKTKYYSVSRAGDAGFKSIPVDGSSKMDDVMMQSIEPFDYSTKTDFNTAYLLGYLADKYDVDAKMCQPHANERIKNSLKDMLRDTVHGYHSCIEEQCNVQLEAGNTEYALLPVWVLNTRYQGKLYTFMMNGQTGKFVGDLPVDKKKFALTFASIFAVVGTVAAIVANMI